MIARRPAVLLALFLLLWLPAAADVGEPARNEITRLQSSRQFAHVPTDHGTIPAEHLERWKFATSDLEQHIFTVDAKNINAPVMRETYIHLTHLDPYSLRPGQATGQPDLLDVLSRREYTDYNKAAAIASIPEAPLHVIAYFYRGKFAAYETIEPAKRKYGSPDRFEWRSFPLSQLQSVMKAARSCDNGPDCAAWY